MAPVGNSRRRVPIPMGHDIQQLSAFQMKVGCMTLPSLEVTPAGQDTLLRPLEVQPGPMDIIALIEPCIWERPQQVVAGCRVRLGTQGSAIRFIVQVLLVGL